VSPMHQLFDWFCIGDLWKRKGCTNSTWYAKIPRKVPRFQGSLAHPNISIISIQDKEGQDKTRQRYS
jgi:hypothetical protein